MGEYARDEACPEPVEGMEMDSMKFISIPWKDFGLCCVPGCGLIEAFRRRNCLGIWLLRIRP
jgi:hypothetical protein